MDQKLNITPHALQAYLRRVRPRIGAYSYASVMDFFVEAYQNGKKVCDILDIRARQHWARVEKEGREYYCTPNRSLRFYRDFVFVFDFAEEIPTVVTVYENDYKHMGYRGEMREILGIKLSKANATLAAAE